MKRLSLLLIAAAIAMAAGCSKTTKTTRRGPGGQEVTMEHKGSESSMEVKTASGDTTKLRSSATGLALGADFPKDVPVYPKAVVKMDNTVGPLRMVGLYIADPVADGVKFYSEEMTKQGWTIGASMPMGEGHMLTLKKDNRSCQLMITKDGKQTYVQITLSTAQ
jgi:hypothetical protein